MGSWLLLYFLTSVILHKKTNKPSSVRVNTNTQVYRGAFVTAHANPISCYGYTAIDWHSSKRDETAVDRVNLIYKGSSQFPIRANTENAMMCILLWHHSNLSIFRHWPLV